MRTNCDDCGKCCDHMLFRVPNQDYAMWAEYHGLRIVKTRLGRYVRVDIPCKHLTKDKKCAVHGTPEQPEMCKKFQCSALSPYGIDIEGVE